jgi:hypothetical protein
MYILQHTVLKILNDYLCETFRHRFTLLWYSYFHSNVIVLFCLQPEPSPSVARVEENTKKIRSIRRPSILRLFLGPLVNGRRFCKVRRKNTVGTFFKRVEGPPFFLRIFLLPSLPPLTHTKVHTIHNYILNSDEGLTDPGLSTM